MGSVVKSIMSSPEAIVSKIISKTLDNAGGVLEGMGMGSLGKEVSRWGEDIDQVLSVLSGEYHDRAKEVEEYGQKIEDAQQKYNTDIDNLVEKMEGLIAFHEIFKMALDNRMDEYIAKYGPVIEAMMTRYREMISQLKSDFDFVIGLTEGAFIQKIVGGLIMIIGGIMSDLGDIVEGKADGKTWQRVVTAIVLIIIIVIMWWNPVGWAAIIAATLATISSIMVLDGMYANGAITGAVMSMLDFIFNDVLNLDDVVGKDFDKFDKDHEDYKEMVMYTQLALALSSMAAGWASAPTQATTQSASISSSNVMSSSSTAGAGGSALNSASAGMTGQTVGTSTSTGASSTSSYLGGSIKIGSTTSNSSFLGVSFSTYSDIYKAFSNASDLKDVVSANDQYERMKNKFQEDIDKLNSAVESKYRKNFMKHYKDTAYFLQDQQEYIDRYLWGMTAQNMYVDPYGTTPVANIRFTPDKDTRIMSFGYEDMFDDSKMAGSKNYFNSIIYG